MTLNLRMPEDNDLKPRIMVFGVGGAGGNAVNNMITQNLEGAEFVVANTDAQALHQTNATRTIQLGTRVTEGLGAGAKPHVGAAAAEESIEEVIDHLAGSHMCFITAGMGGGTGTGAAPIIAQAARELGVLTVGVVTKPFQFEGSKRMRLADEGVAELQKYVDTLIIIPNQNLFRLANEKTTFTEAFMMADDVLYQGVKGVTDLMVRPGIINLDFADVRSVMEEMGKAMMGTGEANGENRAIEAAEKAIANPLLDEISLKGARGVLINVTGGPDLTLFELDEAANRVRDEVDSDANIIVGSTLDPDMSGEMRVSVVATGIDAVARAEPAPQPARRPAERPPVPHNVQESHVPAQPAALESPELVLSNPVDAAPQEGSLFSDEPNDDDLDMGEGSLFSSAATNPAPAQSAAPAQLAYEPVAQVAPQQVARTEMPEPQMAAPAVQPQPAAPIQAPSQEHVQARLKAAVAKQPKAQPAAPAPQPAAEPAADRDLPPQGRFAIKSLINRMNPNQAEAQPAAPQPAPQPAVDPTPAPAAAPRAEERGQKDIPAFLRRQAN